MKNQESREIIFSQFQKNNQQEVQTLSVETKIPLISIYSALKFFKQNELLEEVGGTGTNKIYKVIDIKKMEKLVFLNENDNKNPEPPLKRAENDINEPYKSSRDTSQFSFRKESRGKGQTVLAILKAFVAEKAPTLAEVKKAFPDAIVSKWGVTADYNAAIKCSRQRYFTKHDQVILTQDKKKICVTNQWDVNRFGAFIEVANKLGLKVNRVQKQ